MSKRPTLLDKAIRHIDEKITALALAREELLQQQHEASLEARREVGMRSAPLKTAATK